MRCLLIKGNADGRAVSLRLGLLFLRRGFRGSGTGGSGAGVLAARTGAQFARRGSPLSQWPRSFEHFSSSLPSWAGLICCAFIAWPHLARSSSLRGSAARAGGSPYFRVHDPRLGRRCRSQRSRAGSRCRAARPAWSWCAAHRGRRERAGSPSALSSTREGCAAARPA